MENLGHPIDRRPRRLGHFVGYAVSTNQVTGSPYASPASSINDSIQLSINGTTSASKQAYALVVYGPDGDGAWLTSGSQLSATSAPTREVANTLSTAFSGSTAFAVWPANTGQTANYFDDTLIYQTSGQVCSALNGLQSSARNSPYCTTSTTQNDNSVCGSSAVGCGLSSNAGPGSISATGTTGGSTGNATTGANILTPSGASSPVLFMGNVQGSGTGAQLANNSQACAWLNAPLPWTTSTLRAYYEVSTSYTGQNGDGFFDDDAPGRHEPCLWRTVRPDPGREHDRGKLSWFRRHFRWRASNGHGRLAYRPHFGDYRNRVWIWVFVRPPGYIDRRGNSRCRYPLPYRPMTLSGITVTNVGFGYGNGMSAGADARPAVTIETPAATGCINGSPTTCTQAVASVNSMSVTQVSLSNVGSGYSPVVTLASPGGAGTTATATAIVTNGAITAINVINAGSGYLSAPTVTIGIPGSNATATATIDGNGTVTGITVTAGGSGYGPTISVVPSGDVITNPATVVGSVDASGEISGLSITSVGSGYTKVPTLSVLSPIGCASSCVTAVGSVSGMSVTGISITGSGDNAGSGYVIVPTVTIAAPPSCAICVTATGAAGMSIQDISLSGTGVYVAAPTVTIPPPSVLPRVALEFDTYFYEDDPFYDNYGYNGGTSPPPASANVQSLTNIRHDPNAEHMATDMVDTLYHDDDYPPLDDVNKQHRIYGQSKLRHGNNRRRFGGCTYSSTAANIISGSGPIVVDQNSTPIAYHPVRVEAQRYCDPTCSSCGNSSVAADKYMLIRAYLDCTSAALGGNSCSDMTRNLLIGPIAGSTSGGHFPLGASYSTASTVNYCGIDPGVASPLGITALDNMLFGFTAGAGAVNGSVMIRNLAVGTY